MKTSALVCALAMFFSVTMVSSGTAAAGQAPRMTVGDLTIEGQGWQGNLQQPGPWECTGPVTVRFSGFTMTCDTSFKLWLTADFGDFERVEAEGNVTVEGRYVTADTNTWDVKGRANSASYDRESQRGTLSGAVSFEATNSVTGAALTAVGEKLTYDANTQAFNFERGDTPVRMKWTQPAEQDEAPPAASPPGT